MESLTIHMVRDLLANQVNTTGKSVYLGTITKFGEVRKG